MNNKLPSVFLQNKAKIITTFVMIVVIIFVYCITSSNYQFYSRTIVKVTSCEDVSSKDVVGTNGGTEPYYLQKITGTIKNGENKGETVTFDNEYSKSRVLTTKYTKGNELFIKQSDDGSFVVTGEKRDKYIVFLFLLILLVLLIASEKRGLLTILSLSLNTLAFLICLNFISIGVFLKWVWIPLIFVFTIVTLLFASGVNKKTLGAIISAVFTIGLILLIYYFSVYKFADLPYEGMDYVVAFLPLKQIYLISVIIGCLGAITDVCITINSSVYELVDRCDSIDIKTLIHSTRQISYDIMGTMMNVLFFSYVSGAVPLIVLKLQCGINLGLIMNYDFIFEIIRFLIGSIGIVLAIPISAVFAVFLNQRRKKQK